ncbi:hypothetical protein HYPSUDRAFT_200088 [Hypholoma sublateritium FD-334 SS-4]|uniref:Uncharacterized protein n=1 Tax=Hypholoma sublateritium (strain FD-334 SS-4) TaxID=945553 RepID=A0A0D2P9H8_HYPSF|nr:hypothetical protein HYPSUDRAFT_200088 [Hypholoma sublateritium FD-334 SS-4]
MRFSYRTTRARTGLCAGACGASAFASVLAVCAPPAEFSPTVSCVRARVHRPVRAFVRTSHAHITYSAGRELHLARWEQGRAARCKDRRVGPGIASLSRRYRMHAARPRPTFNALHVLRGRGDARPDGMRKPACGAPARAAVSTVHVRPAFSGRFLVPSACACTSLRALFERVFRIGSSHPHTAHSSPLSPMRARVHRARPDGAGHRRSGRLARARRRARPVIAFKISLPRPRARLDGALHLPPRGALHSVLLHACMQARAVRAALIAFHRVSFYSPPSFPFPCVLFFLPTPRSGSQRPDQIVQCLRGASTLRAVCTTRYHIFSNIPSAPVLEWTPTSTASPPASFASSLGNARHARGRNFMQYLHAARLLARASGRSVDILVWQVRACARAMCTRALVFLALTLFSNALVTTVVRGHRRQTSSVLGPDHRSVD